MKNRIQILEVLNGLTVFRKTEITGIVPFTNSITETINKCWTLCFNDLKCNSADFHQPTRKCHLYTSGNPTTSNNEAYTSFIRMKKS